jgi:hypothetical protein
MPHEGKSKSVIDRRFQSRDHRVLIDDRHPFDTGTFDLLDFQDIEAGVSELPDQ